MRILLPMALALSASGCSRGVTRYRCLDLLSQAREHHRECRRMLTAYEDYKCKGAPTQTYSTVEMGVAGY